MIAPGRLEMIKPNVLTVIKNIQLITEGVWCPSISNKNYIQDYGNKI
jgi:hypothetical protein